MTKQHACHGLRSIVQTWLHMSPEALHLLPTRGRYYLLKEGGWRLAVCGTRVVSGSVCVSVCVSVCECVCECVCESVVHV